MINPVYSNVNRIEFVMTYDCTGQCRHCSRGDKHAIDGDVRSISASRAAEIVTEAAALFSLTSVMAFGGEPLLRADIVCATIGAAAQSGIAVRQLITNGCFAKSEERICEVAEALAAAGLNDLLVSADAFHQETLPLETVRFFAESARNAGIPKIRITPAWVVNEAHDNPYNTETRRILAEFSALGFPIVEGNDIHLVGNAAVHLAKFYEGLPPTVSPYDETWDSLTSLSIEPNGDVLAAFDTVIGNVCEKNLREMLI